MRRRICETDFLRNLFRADIKLWIYWKFEDHPWLIGSTIYIIRGDSKIYFKSQIIKLSYLKYLKDKTKHRPFYSSCVNF